MDGRASILIIGPRGICGNEGGVEKFAEEFVRRIARDCRTTVLCLSGEKPKGAGDIELILAPRSNFMHTDKLFYYGTAAWICLSRRFDHVMLLGLNSAMLLLVLRLTFWRRAHVVVRSGSIDYILDKWGFLSKLYFRLAERLLRFADLVVAVAPSIQRHLAGRGIRSVLIRNGLDGGSAAPRPVADREPRHVVAVGRVTAQKNYGQLIEAARLLRDRDVRVTIIGGADLSGEAANLQAVVREAAIANVTFAGAMERACVLERLATASLLVNCSLHEGMSNSILEAIQHGTPILLSDIAANRDLGLPDAFYFDPRSPADLAAKMEKALEAPADFLVDRARFDDWDEVVRVYRRHMNLPPERSRDDTSCGESLAGERGR
jgi:glycosyltransferase involved in cell wall biosynthesis